MGITDDIAGDYYAALAALAWQVDLGADEALSESPVSAYDLPDKPGYLQRAAPAPAISAASAAAPAASQINAADLARARAADCTNLPALESEIAAFEPCELRKGARGVAHGIGAQQAALLILCDPPSPEAEKDGMAMPPHELALLGQMLATIGLSFDTPDALSAVHLAPILPWALRGAPDLHAEALAMMAPFAARRIALIQPKAVILMGHAALAQQGTGLGMIRARGQWHNLGHAVVETPARAMPMPAILIKTSEAKRAAWADLLAIKQRLRQV